MNPVRRVRALRRGLPVWIERVSAAALGGGGDGARTGPDLVVDPKGPAWLVTQSASADVTERFWQLLRDPTTYGP